MRLSTLCGLHRDTEQYQIAIKNKINVFTCYYDILDLIFAKNRGVKSRACVPLNRGGIFSYCFSIVNFTAQFLVFYVGVFGESFFQLYSFITPL